MSINDISRQQPGDTDLANAFRQAKRRVDDRLPAVSQLAGEVEELSRRSKQSIELLGEIVATFSLDQNRKLLQEVEPGRLLLDIADRWARRFQEIVAPDLHGRVGELVSDSRQLHLQRPGRQERR